MSQLLLSVHVLAAILTVGPVTVAASMFPRYAKSLAGAEPEPAARAVAVLACWRACAV